MSEDAAKVRLSEQKRKKAESLERFSSSIKTLASSKEENLIDLFGT